MNSLSNYTTVVIHTRNSRDNGILSKYKYNQYSYHASGNNELNSTYFKRLANFRERKNIPIPWKYNLRQE